MSGGKERKVASWKFQMKENFKFFHLKMRLQALVRHWHNTTGLIRHLALGTAGILAAGTSGQPHRVWFGTDNRTVEGFSHFLKT